MSPSSTSRRPGEFIAALGLRDVVLMNLVAVVGLRWITRGARAGAPSVTLWALACLTFFVPLAAVLMELASRHPDQGGLYAWTRRALGPVHGFVCGWCLWVNNLFYFPALLLFAAANALLVFGDRFAALAESPAYSVAFVLAGLWFCVGINILGLKTAKWLQNVGSIGTWIPATLLIVAGAVAFATFGSATSFAPTELWPDGDYFSTLSLWSAMCFAFAGFEITSFVGQEVKDPKRTIPRGILIAGVATTVIYMLGSASVLVAVPSTALAERSGIADAIEIVSQRVGLAGLGGLTGALIALGALAGNSSWTAGAARVPFAAGVDRVMPSAFARMHPKYPNTSRGADHTRDHLVGSLPQQPLPFGHRKPDVDPGIVRHPREPDDPDLLHSISLSVRLGDSFAARDIRGPRRAPDSGRQTRSVAGCRRGVSCDHFGDGLDVRTTVRHGERPELRGEPGPSSGLHHPDRRRALLEQWSAVGVAQARALGSRL